MNDTADTLIAHIQCRTVAIRARADREFGGHPPPEDVARIEELTMMSDCISNALRLQALARAGAA